MSRKYMNSKWCVRCNRQGPTPFLKKHMAKLMTFDGTTRVQALPIMDVGCGNGRNLRYLKACGYQNTVGFDMANDYGYALSLGKERLPLLNNSVSVILANYVFMFLSKAEARQVVREIRRVAKPNCRLMVELYPAKDSKLPTDEACTQFQQWLIKAVGWKPIVNNKHRCILQNT